MTSFVRPAVLSLVMLSGVASIAYAQSENLAALPPAGTVAAPAPVTAPVAPAAAQLGPEPGNVWNPQESQARQARSAPQYALPTRNSDMGSDSD